MITCAPIPFVTHLRATLFLALPLIGSHMAQFMLNVTDTLMLGWYGILPLAAGVLGGSSFLVVFVLGSGFAKAVMPLASAANAERNAVQFRRITRMGLWLSVLFGLLIYPMFWFSGPILLRFNQAHETAYLAQSYLRIAGIGIIPALQVLVLTSSLAALGRAQVVLLVTLLALPVNAALNWWLIFGHWGGPELGVVGSAIATLLVQSFAFSLLACYAIYHPALKPYSLFARLYRPDWEGARAVFRLGWPMGFTGVFEASLFHASVLLMGMIGTIELAAHGIALQITALTFMAHIGLSNAATIRIGYFYGMHDYAAMRRGALASGVLSLCMISGTITLFLMLPEPLIALFLPKDATNTAVIVIMGATLLSYAAMFQFTDGLQALVIGLLSGVQDTKVPMVLTAVSYWCLGIPAAYIFAFPLGFGAFGVWLGMILGLGLAALSLTWRFLLYLRAHT